MDKKEEGVVPTKATVPGPAAAVEEEGDEPQPHLEPFEEGVDVEEVENEEDFEQQPTPRKVRTSNHFSFFFFFFPRNKKTEYFFLFLSFLLLLLTSLVDPGG